LLNLDAGFESFETFKEEILGRLDALADIRDSERVFGVDQCSFESLEQAKTDLDSMAKIYECQRAYRGQLRQFYETLVPELVVANVYASVVAFGRTQLSTLPKSLHSHRLFAAVREEIDDIETDLNLI